MVINYMFNVYDLFVPCSIAIMIAIVMLLVVMLKKQYIPNSRCEISEESVYYNDIHFDKTNKYNEHIEMKLMENGFLCDSIFEYNSEKIGKIYVRNNGKELEGVYIIESNDVDYELLDSLGTHVYKIQKKYKKITTSNHNIYNCVVVLGDLNSEFYNNILKGNMDEMYFGLVILNNRLRVIKTNYTRINSFIDSIINLIKE